MARKHRAGTFSGQSRGSGAYVTWQNADLVSSILEEIEDGLRKQTNKELRDAAKEIARDVVIPQLKRAARSDPAPIARAMAETARPKADRIVMVQIGGVNPPLEGFKRGIGSKRAKGQMASGRDRSSRNYRTTLAWGSEFGPWPGGRAVNRDGSRGAPVNHYRIGRRNAGWVTNGTTNAIPEAVKRYNHYLEKLITTRSRYR